MKKLTLILLALLTVTLVLPVCADDTVQVQRKVKQKKDFTTLPATPVKPVVITPSPQEKLQLMKNKSRQYAQYRLSIPKSKEHLVEEKDFCNVSYYIQSLGGERPIVTFENLKNLRKSNYKIGNTTYNNVNYCIKVEFDYLGKHYEDGACRK